MIDHISIVNYALISELNLSMNEGMTTITGETGAGKSILLGAIGLALGKRADTNVLLNKSEKCIIEITANIKGLSLQSFFEDNELDYADESILRREITPSGRSRAFINDTPVNAGTLQELGSRLVDIHSQHDTLLLNNKSYQLQMIDILSKNSDVLEVYRKKYYSHLALIEKKSNLAKKAGEENDLDYLNFLSDELFQANIVIGEEENLENELNTLEHAEEIARNLSEVIQKLNAEQGGIIDGVQSALINLRSISKLNEGYSNLEDRLNSVKIELNDLLFEFENELEKVNLDPSELEKIQDRYNLLQSLFAKHRVSSTQDLSDRFKTLNEQLESIVNRDQMIAKIDKEILASKNELLNLAERLSETRKQVLPVLIKRAKGILSHLNFVQFEFTIELERTEEPGPSGIDRPKFLFSANPGAPVQEIGKIASGGEMSRVMLALKAILADTHQLPTIVFDEIDSGVSGETASKMAEILKEMGNKMQVWAITHLPQIAAAGNAHLVVEKIASQSSTRTDIRYVSGEERVKTIAKMLSHSSPTNAAIENARDLISVS